MSAHGEERVVLVDEEDRPRGTSEKLEAHRSGELHRAFSVLLFNRRGELLLQRRALGKYHSGGLWTNTCCGHPRPGEITTAAARRRLGEEMGIDCELVPLFSFIYRADLDGGLTEHELDHVLVGRWDADPLPDPEEAEDWRWVPFETLRSEVEARPELFTFWFRRILEEYPTDASPATPPTPQG